MESEKCFFKLEEICDTVNKEVNNEIRNILQEDSELFQVLESIPYTLSCKGKRKRAIMVYLCYFLKQEKSTEELKYLAVFVELMQTASLVHDDIIDNSDLRRGKKTVNKKYGDNTAIITGDFLIFKAFKILANLSNKYYKEIVNILSGTFTKMCYGQELEKDFMGNINVDDSKYYNMIYMKTAVFLEKICECAFILGDAGENDIESIRKFGKYYGMAYQIKDDMKFFIEEEESKSLKSDIDRRLVTLPIIYAMKNADINDSKYLTEVYNYKREPDYERIKDIVTKSQALKYVEEKYNSFLEKAILELRKIKDSEVRKIMLLFIGGSKREEVEECLI